LEPPQPAKIPAFNLAGPRESVLNTSLNIHEEPIVCSPADAVATLLAGDV
jgi:predicted NodU family carbamoyl transferase